MLAGDRVSGTDADRHEDISHNGSSWFGGYIDSAETIDLARVVSQIAAPPSVVQKNNSGCPKKAATCSS